MPPKHLKTIAFAPLPHPPMCVYIYIQVMPSVTLNNFTPPNIIYLDVNFDHSTTGLHYIRIFFMITKIKDD